MKHEITVKLTVECEHEDVEEVRQLVLDWLHLPDVTIWDGENPEKPAVIVGIE